MTQKKHMKQHLDLEKAFDFTQVAPPGTDTLPLAERIHVYLHVFESGCSVSQPPIGNGKPESCPECVRAFVDAVKVAVDEVIADDPMSAMLNLTRPPGSARENEGGENSL